MSSIILIFGKLALKSIFENTTALFQEFIHERNGLFFLYCERIKLPVVYAQSPSVVFLLD
jgi:hypothetical protein